MKLGKSMDELNVKTCLAVMRDYGGINGAEIGVCCPNILILGA